jgi:hypothetical protein
VPWITITSSAHLTGSGIVTFLVAANAGDARTGTLTIAGRTFTVTQASGCVFAINPTSHTFDKHGGTFDISVTTTAGCSWTASSSAAWITIASGVSGNGKGTVKISVPSLSGSQSSRTDVAIVAGQTFTVRQNQN